MASIGRIHFPSVIINSSCAWASDEQQLQALYESPFTGGVTTRTATLNGFDENRNVHTVNFTKESISSINSYGYSPNPLSSYIEWVGKLLQRGESKPIIMSITSSYASELSKMVDQIQELRKIIGDTTGETSRLAIELNTSCPNIENKPPPAYTPELLKPLLEALAEQFWNDPTLVIGLKLPPYTYSTQFQDVFRLIEGFTREDRNPITFLTCTNTLGSSLLYEEQATDPSIARSPFALPTPLGGFAGEAIHALALGNVYSFSKLLAKSDFEAVRKIFIIGVGGVTSPGAVKRMLTAGAKVVACATLLGKEGVAGFEQLSTT